MISKWTLITDNPGRTSRMSFIVSSGHGTMPLYTLHFNKYFLENNRNVGLNYCFAFCIVLCDLRKKKKRTYIFHCDNASSISACCCTGNTFIAINTAIVCPYFRQLGAWHKNCCINWSWVTKYTFIFGNVR